MKKVIVLIVLFVCSSVYSIVDIIGISEKWLAIDSNYDLNRDGIINLLDFNLLCREKENKMSNITTVSDLYKYAAVDGSHVINTGVYELTGPLVITGDWDLTVNITNVSEYSDVIIDGMNAYNIDLEENNTVFTGTSSSKIIFRRMLDYVQLDSNVSDMTANFSHCEFTKCYNGNGLQVATNPAGDVTLTCNFCNSYNNVQDGFSLISGNTNSKDVIMNLNSCNAYWNDNDPSSAVGSGNGDGATMHTAGQNIYIDGGSYYQNGKAGVSVVGGDNLSINGATFYQNGNIVQNNGDIYILGVASPLISNCTFTGHDSQNFSFYTINTASGVTTLTIRNSTFTSPGKLSPSDKYIYVLHADTTMIDVGGCVFTGISSAGSYAVSGENPAQFVKINHCTFYNCRAGSRAQGNMSITNNIFYGGNFRGVYDDAGNYLTDPNNGYNIFLNITKVSNGGNLSTDINIDPLFVDAADNNFEPLSSIAWNSGRTSEGNVTYIGGVIPGYGGRTGLDEGSSINIYNDTSVYFATKENGNSSDVNVGGTTFTVQDTEGRLVWNTDDWMEHIFNSNNDSIGENIIRFNSEEERFSVSWEGGAHLFDVDILDFPNYSINKTYYTLDAPRVVFTGTYVPNNGTGIAEEWFDHFINTKTSDFENNTVTSQNVLYFEDSVNIKLEFSYPPKDYSALTDSQFVGKFPYSSSESKSEIYYTLNGKNPTIQSNIYRGEFTLSSNTLGDNIILKAMIAYKGQFSPVYKAEIVIV